MTTSSLADLLDAAETLIEANGDTREINRLLLSALRDLAGHQPEKRKRDPALDAIATLAQAEASRLAPPRPPAHKASDARLADLMGQGYQLLRIGQAATAFDLWQQAWQMVKELAAPELRTVADFDYTHLGLPELVFNWAQDFEMELSSTHDPALQELRLRYTCEFLARFPEEDDATIVTFTTGQGEALWELGRRPESEALFADLVSRFPDNVWTYIAWSDQHWLSDNPEQPKDHAAAEALLRRALGHAPNADDRRSVLERLDALYTSWGKTEERATIAKQLAELGDQGQ